MKLSLTMEASRLIAAPRPLVWQVFAHIMDWPSWNPHCRRVDLRGRPGAGGTAALPLEQEGLDFSFSVRPLGWPITVAAQVVTARPGQEVAWRARCWGIASLHGYTFADAGGGTLVHTREELTGFPLLLLRAVQSPRQLCELNHQWLKALAERAESLARGRRV